MWEAGESDETKRHFFVRNGGGGIDGRMGEVAAEAGGRGGERWVV